MASNTPTRIDIKFVRPLLTDGTHGKDFFLEHDNYSYCDFREYRFSTPSAAGIIERLKEMYDYCLKEYQDHRSLFRTAYYWHLNKGRTRPVTNEMIRSGTYHHMVIIKIAMKKVAQNDYQITLQ